MMDLFTIFIYICVFFVTNSSPIERSTNLIDIKSIVETVNSYNTTWKARINPGFEDLTFEQARCLTGVIPENVSQVLPPAPHMLGGEEDIWLSGAPTNFDARNKYYGCIGSIRNQGQCGSCWAFAATSSLADRLCIYSRRTVDVILSPQQLVSCDTSSYGCEGGYISQAWKYMKETGTVTEDCYAYKSGYSRYTGECYLSEKECPSSTYVMPEFYYTVYGAYPISGITKIMYELYTKGPVETALYIYEDFYAYSRGVYKYTYGSLIGVHAVKMLGWGVDDDGYPYWLCANSWGNSWGYLGGYFKILKGYNECQVESYIVAG